MNIEVANRLQQLRKAKGLSQEELANILGLSRQAISKWERAETSPDTDNLICLARLYNISIDKLLDTSESMEEIKERIAQERINKVNCSAEDTENNEEEIKNEKTDLINEDETEKSDEIALTDEEAELKRIRETKKFNLNFCLIVIGILSYIFTGMITSDWSWGWPLIFLAWSIGCFLTDIFIDRTASAISLVFGIGFACIFYLINSESNDNFYIYIALIFMGLLFLVSLIPIIVYVIFNMKNRKDLAILNEKDEIIRLQEKCKRIIEANEKYKREIKDINK